jgi:hypothetical protein
MMADFDEFYGMCHSPQRQDSLQEHGSSHRREPRPLKVVLAVENDWCGEIYSTRAGGKRFSFDGPAALLAAVQELTGWDAKRQASDSS